MTSRTLPAALVFMLLAGCGARTPVDDDFFDGAVGPTPQPETCNGLDDDLDTGVDEDFRDALGRYVHDEHCGACDAPCRPLNPNELAVTCTLIEESPVCAATACAAGYGVSSAGRCIPAWDRLCLPCASDGDCGDLPSARCVALGGEDRCTVGCELGCPSGYACDADGLCAPEGGSCSCDPGETFTLACALTDPEGLRCVGSSLCDDGVLAECVAPAEVCDEVDNDCNGFIDDGFRDARDAYILDVHNCGECGVDCTLSAVPEGDLICGGDPFAPTCVLDCPDTHDGIDPGDRVDGDRDIATGCECTVTSLADDPGPVGAVGEDLDVNCDGADGIVIHSIYVAGDGDDAWPGSPTRPMRSVDAALARAAETLGTDEPRPHVFVASGSYAETLHLPDGVQLHGGYRRDYLALEPDGFRVEIRAPADTTAPGGAALEIRGAGTTATVVEWISLRGLDATEPSAAAFGAYLLDPGPALVLRELEIRSGVGGAGTPGNRGAAGSASTAEARAGDPPRAAVENTSHECVRGAANTVAGGRGGQNTCDSIDVAGGTGGSPTCPEFAEQQPNGRRGNAVGSLLGGPGGTGGQDSQGPITGSSCSLPVCCGLADFTVPTEFVGPQAGSPGRDGSPGTPGAGCSDALGHFAMDIWMGDRATRGTAGGAGTGGGGGGAGGGAVMDWYAGACEFPDGLGGGGGGGGCGGCGGRLGQPGTSGGPAVALLVRYTTRPSAVPTFRGMILVPSDGGRGGDGGAGGDGGIGGTGAQGGSVPREDRATPTLAGPFPGGRGGAGGNGGPGGGAGGGCGGSAVGVWLTGAGSTAPPGVAAWRTGNMFRLGRGGVAGLGGGGGAAAPAGAEGGAVDVVVR